MNTSEARGLIAVDKMGGKVIFLDPISCATTTVLDNFERVPHGLRRRCRHYCTRFAALDPINSPHANRLSRRHESAAAAVP
jgi:hypothetical protein